MTSQAERHDARGRRIPHLPVLGIGDVPRRRAQRVNSPYVCPRSPPITVLCLINPVIASQPSLPIYLRRRGAVSRFTALMCFTVTL